MPSGTGWSRSCRTGRPARGGRWSDPGASARGRRAPYAAQGYPGARADPAAGGPSRDLSRVPGRVRRRHRGPAGGTVTVTMRNGPSPGKIRRGADLVGIRLGSARRAVSSAHRATAPCARAPPRPPPRVPGWGAPRRPRRGPAGLRRGSPRPAPSHCPPGRTGRLRRAPPVSVR